MASPDILNALDECIMRLASGQSLEDCLRDYPQFASTLRPLLQTGQLIRRAQYSSVEVEQAQEVVNFRIEQILNTTFPQQRRVIGGFAGMVAGMILVLSILFTGATAFAQHSIPGDILYPLKRLSENTRLSINIEGSQLEQQFNQRRVNEARRLSNMQREAEITFRGRIESIDEDDWMIAGLLIRVDRSVRGAAGRITDEFVDVDAISTSDGQLVAIAIDLIDSPKADTPVVEPTNTPTITTSPSTTSTERPARPTVTPTQQLSSHPTIDGANPIQPTRPAVTRESSSVDRSCPLSPPTDWVRYTIARGDTLSGIALASGSSIEELRRVNCLIDTRLIVAGHRIYLPRQPLLETSPSVSKPSDAERTATQQAGVGPMNNDDTGEAPRRPDESSGNSPTPDPARR